MNSLIPLAVIFVSFANLFLVGKHLQRLEKTKRLEKLIRERAMHELKSRSRLKNQSKAVKVRLLALAKH